MALFFETDTGGLPDLYTDRLLLRMISIKDAEDMYRYSCDPEVARHVLWRAHDSLSDTKSHIRYLISQYKQNKPSSFAIIRRDNSRMIGTIGFIWINEDHNSAEVGYSLSREEWNKGYMTEALQTVLRFGFEDLQLHRIEAQHEIDNPASGIVMQKCGMQREGLMRERLYNKGAYVDVYVYAILKREFMRAFPG